MKTIEEAAYEYSKNMTELRKNGQQTNISLNREDYQQEGFIAGVEFAQRWVPIEENTEIPFNEYILIKNDYKPATTYLRGELDLKFVKASFNFWRPIELK
jgi:hypothetical protein